MNHCGAPASMLPSRRKAGGCIALLSIIIAVSLTATAQAATYRLQPGEGLTYRCSGNSACVRAVYLGRERLRLIAPVCWSSRGASYEDCTVGADCRRPYCWLRNGSRVTVRVRLRGGLS